MSGRMRSGRSSARWAIGPIVLSIASLTFLLACARSTESVSPEVPAASGAEIRTVEWAHPEGGDSHLELEPPSFDPLWISEPEERPRPAALRLLQSGRFSLDVQAADFRSILVGLVRSSPFSLIVEDDVSGELTADLRDVSLFDIFEQVVVPRGYTYELDDLVITVGRPRFETRTYHIDYPSYEREGQSDLTVFGAIESSPDLGSATTEASDSSSSSLSTRQKQDFWLELTESLQSIVHVGSGDDSETAGRQVLVADQSGLVLVRAETPVLDEVEDFLQEMARTNQKQVLIDTRILEVTLSDDLDFGIDLEYSPDLGNSSAGTVARLIDPTRRNALLLTNLSPVLSNGGFTFGVSRDSLSARLRALAAQTDVRVVSTPRVSTLNNHKALIKVVRNQVFFIAETDVQLVEGVGTSIATQFVPQIIPIGVTLDVTPRISESREITLHIHPSVSEVVAVQNQPSSDPAATQVGSLPVIDLRETDTVVRVRDGETIVIGGLIRSRELDMESKVPFFGDLPLVGTLFRSTNVEELRTELVILLTPTVMRGPTIQRVTERGRAGVDALDALRRERRPRRQWWRKPIGRSYGDTR